MGVCLNGMSVYLECAWCPDVLGAEIIGSCELPVGVEICEEQPAI